jgi:hypothetical protein
MKTGLERLPEGWVGIVSEEYLSGASDVEVKAALRMTTKLWDNLYNDPESSEFREIVDFGRMLSKAWWMTQARTNLHDRKFNANLWYMVMKNQFGWSEKSTTTNKTAETMTTDELDAKVRKAVEKFVKTVKA